ncbi:MAG: ABC transporter substrate-binding protein [Lachnospiraceae bacterium]|nr:ABC transporter substrate-binding protein [Lachnospiraceae bacterium]
MKKGLCLASLSLAVLTAFSLTACTKDESGLKKVKLNEVVHSIFYAPQYVALELGMFEEEGLDVELSVGNGADKSMTALISGDADIALLGTEAGIYVYNEGREDHAKAFAQLTQRAGNFLVSREDNNFKWEDVIGKEIIGGRTGGMPQLVLEYVLKQKGIIPGEDVEIINNIAFTSTAGAFAGGEGDFTAEFEPTATAIEENGGGYIAASLGTESGYIPYTVYMAQKSYIEANPDIIQRFTNAIYKGQLWVNSHSAEEIAEVVAPFFTESEVSSLTKIIDRYKAQDTWKEDPMFDKDGFTLIQDIMEEGGELGARVPFDKFIDTTFAEKAVTDIK